MVWLKQWKLWKRSGGEVPAAALTIGCTVLSVLLVLYSPLAQQGAKQGLAICGQVIIPSLYPFFVLAGLFGQMGSTRRQRPGRGKLLWKLLRQPPAALGAILLGFLGGYPLGAAASARLMEQGQLTRSQAQRLQLFCVNAGPAYLIGAMGVSMLGSRRAGIVLFVSMLSAGLLLGLLTRALPDEPDESQADCEQASLPRKGFDQMLLSSVSQATGSILNVCAWVVLFSALCALLHLLPHALWPAIPTLHVALEVSSGAAAIVRAGLPMPVLCAALGWGGLGVHCQILGDLRKTGLPLRLFWVSRLLHGAMASAICWALLRRFPIELAASAVQGAGQAVKLWAVSAPAAAAILFFCAFLIMDLDLNRKMC